MIRYNIFRFSLTTLFVLVTGLCIWLGTEVNRVRHESDVANAIVKSGGRVRYGYEFDNNGKYIPEATRPKWSTLLGDGFLQEIVEVSFMGVIILEIRDTTPFITGVKRKTVPKKVLERLKGLRGLKTLVLSTTDVSDSDIEYLTELRSLDYLRLDGNAITARGARKFGVLDNLRKLDLRQTKVSQYEISTLIETMPDVEIVAEYRLSQGELPETRVFVHKVRYNDR